MNDQKKVVIIAGPNGAGKTTFAREFLPNEGHCPNFINADLIAAGLSPFAPEQASVKAGRLMLKSIKEHASHGRRFALETTFSGLGYARAIPGWRALGYHVKLLINCPMQKQPSPALPNESVKAVITFRSQSSEGASRADSGTSSRRTSLW